MLVLLACKQDAEVVVQPTTAVVALIDDDRLLLTVLIGEDVGIYLAERRTVHSAYMHIGHLAS